MNKIASCLMSLFGLFYLYYDNNLVAFDFDQILVAHDKRTNEVSVSIVGIPSSHFDFKKYLNRPGFKYIFKTRDFKEQYDNMVLTRYIVSVDNGHETMIIELHYIPSNS